jgi:hypothetical protein
METLQKLVSGTWTVFTTILGVIFTLGFIAMWLNFFGLFQNNEVHECTPYLSPQGVICE